MRQLINTPDGQLKKLPLSDYIREEIAEARTMSRSALKRQVGFISKRMADEPVEQAIRQLGSLQQPAAQANAHFHQLEKWREQLLAGDENVLEQLVQDYAADRQQLRQLVRNAQRELTRQQPPKTARAMFQYLRTLTERGVDADT